MSKPIRMALVAIGVFVLIATVLATVLVTFFGVRPRSFSGAQTPVALTFVSASQSSDDPTPDRAATRIALLATPLPATPFPPRPAAQYPAGPAPRPTLTAATILTQLDQPPLAAPQPGGPEPFTLFGVTAVRTDYADWFFGEVRNDTGATRTGVRIRVVTFDSAGKELRTEEAFAKRGYLLPGEVAPFRVALIDGDKTPFARFQLEVRSNADTRFAEGYQRRGIVPEPDPKVALSPSRWKIAGWAVNREAETVAFPELTAVFYDAQGNVVGLCEGFAETDSSKALVAGARARYELSWSIFSGPPASFRVYGEGSRKT